MADGGLETGGRGRGVEIWGLIESLLPFKDFLRDFMFCAGLRGR